MEKKRKMPPRAAARGEQASKKRTATPPDNRSLTPAPAPAPAPAAPVVDETPPPPPLPKSIQPGKPLPVVDDPQPDDLSSKEYQSIQESGVAGESLHRSRQKWISEGIFEKYWTKPSKRKGVVIEEPNNPPKDSMSKLGAVTVIVEPHIFEATVYGVKDPKPPVSAATASVRPVLQYGPPNGVMPPPPPPATASTPSTPTVAPTQSPAPTSTHPQPDSHGPQSATSTEPTAVPAGPEPRGSDPTVPPVKSEEPSSATAAPNPAGASSSPATATPTAVPQTPTEAPATSQPSFPSRPPPPPSATPGSSHSNGAPPPAAGAKAAPVDAGTDPIIVILAEKATEDAYLRDLMTRVAGGFAPKDELQKFQAIIDKITAETKRNGTKQGPSADRLIVCGKTVRYFADEVRAILDIVLSSNPLQTSANLNPPEGSDPLVVLLVKKALDDSRTREIVRRIADNRPMFSDAPDLRQILDQLAPRAAKELEKQRKASASGHSGTKQNGAVNGVHAQSTPAAPQQALRSKGPPPPPKPDISAVVFEFSGGTGDRYLFPKFSIAEIIPGPNGPQLLASFVVVRKGSTSEYGGDPTRDYWQALTIRLQSPSQRLLENISKVVAPPEEVRRYMNDVMDNMTRAEYVLLAMRLPRAEVKDDKEPAAGGADKDSHAVGGGAGKSASSEPQPQDGVLWTARATPASSSSLKPANKVVGEDEQYQKFIASVTPMELDDA